MNEKIENIDKLNAAFESGDFAEIIDSLRVVFEEEYGGPIRYSQRDGAETPDAAHRRAGKLEAIKEIKDRYNMYLLAKKFDDDKNVSTAKNTKHTST